MQFNSQGDLLAVVGLSTENGLTLVPVNQGQLGQPKTFSMELPERIDIPFDPASHVRFHPTADIVAVDFSLVTLHHQQRHRRANQTRRSFV